MSTFFFIYSNLDKNLVIDVEHAAGSPGTALQIYKKNYGSNQLWTLVASNGYSYIQSHLANSASAGTPLVVDIAGGQATDHSTLEVNTRSGAGSQLWAFAPVPGEGVAIASSLNSNKVVDVKHAADKSGTALQVYSSHNGAGQLWSLSPHYSASMADLHTHVIANVAGPLGIYDSFSLKNTGTATWTGFRLTVTNPQQGTPPYFVGSYEGPGAAGISGSGAQNILTLTGLGIAPGSVLNFSVEILFGEGGWYLTGNAVAQ